MVQYPHMWLYRLKRLYHFLVTGLRKGFPSQIRYHNPQKKLKIICVTGTDGKTTSSSMIYHLLKTAGYKVGLVSTVAAYIGDQEIDTGFHTTAPEVDQLYSIMNQMVQAKIEYLVLEATSHGIYQYRTWGIKPLIGALTNLDREHLDYHKTPEEYWKAKALMLQQSKTVVLNEEMSARNFVEKLLPPATKKIYFGPKINLGKAMEKAIRDNFAENYNRLNAKLAVTVARLVGAEDKALLKALSDFSLPRGRMQLIDNSRGLTIIVDFAHTPQALEAALQNIRRNFSTKKGRLISAFGCAGLRDYTKRAPMGRIGAHYSDFAVFTAEDPRKENIWSIFNQMKSDLGERHDRVITIAHRADALNYVFHHLARPGDTVVFFGKGHEQSMNYGHGEEAWDDVEEIKKLLAADD